MTVPHSTSTSQTATSTSQWNSQVYAPRLESGLDEEEGSEEEVEGEMTGDLMRIAVVAGLGGLLFGFDTGVVSGALLSLSHSPPLNSDNTLLSTTQESWLVSSALIGALGASLFAGRLADGVGRKSVIVGAAVLFALGAAEMAAAQVYKEIILGRVLVGLGVGLASCVLPTYLAELSPPKYRGRFVASLVVLITFGQVLAYMIDALFISVQQGWRWMFGIGTIPALVQLLLSFSLPESPRYLLVRGKVAKGRQVIARLNPGWSATRVQREIEKILGEVGDRGTMRRDQPERLDRNEREGVGGSWWRRTFERTKGLTRIDWEMKRRQLVSKKESYLELLWRDRANRRALLVACGLQFFQQSTGFNSLMYYSTKIIQQTHLSSPATFALLIAISNFICTLLALRLIDHTGRRKLLLRGLMGMLAGMIVLSISFIFIPRSKAIESMIQEAGAKAGAPAIISLIGMTVFCCCYALSIGNIPWVVQSEVFDQELKGIGTGLATSVNWVGNLFVSSTFLHISKSIGPSGAFGIFGLICLLGWIFTWIYLPETKGLSLEEVRQLFEKETPATSSLLKGRDGNERETGDGNGYQVVGDTEEEESGESAEDEGNTRTREGTV